MNEHVFALPDVGEGLTEAEILRWLVAPGDEVVVNQMLVEIETAKAAVELPSMPSVSAARAQMSVRPANSTARLSRKCSQIQQ